MQPFVSGLTGQMIVLEYVNCYGGTLTSMKNKHTNKA